MKQNKQLIRCLKKKLYGGRGLFSRTVDYIALRAIVFMGCYMWFSAMVANGVAKAMLSLASTGFISVGLDLINSLRLDSLIRAERRRVSAAALNDRLLLMTDDERNRLIAEHISKEGKQADRLICSVHRSEGPTPDDMLKAALAGLLHDCAKLPPEKQYELAKEYGMDVSSMAQPIIHGPLGAVRARRVFGITDNDVLSAISCHTTCKSRMTALDKIVYLADKIEQGRIYDGVEDIRRETDENLDRGMVCCIEHAIDHVEREKKGKITPETYIALNEIKKSLEGNND